MYEIEVDENYIYINGREILDLESSIQLEDEIRSYLDLKFINFCIFDFQKTNYVSSAGIRVLLFIVKMLSYKNGKLILININDHIKKILTITGIINKFIILKNKEEALKYINEHKKEKK